MNDVSLVRKCIEGNNKEAFGLLIERYEKAIYAVCFSYVLNEDDAQSLTQDTFVHAYYSLSTLNNPDSLQSWLSKIARNTSLDFIKTKGKGKIVTSSLIGDVEDAKAIDDTETEHGDMAKLFKEIEALSQELREVITLKYMEGMSYEDISKLLDIPKTTVRSRIFEAKNLLKDALKGIED